MLVLCGRYGNVNSVGIISLSFHSRLSAAASSTIEEVKTQGRAGLEHSISQKKVCETLPTPVVMMGGVCNTILDFFPLYFHHGVTRYSSEMIHYIIHICKPALCLGLCTVHCMYSVPKVGF